MRKAEPQHPVFRELLESFLEVCRLLEGELDLGIRRLYRGHVRVWLERLVVSDVNVELLGVDEALELL